MNGSGSFPWGWTVLGVVALLVAWLLLTMRRMTKDLRRTGVRTLATIVRMANTRMAPAGYNPSIELTLEWTMPDGTPHTEKVVHRCDVADMPQQGDKAEIVYSPVQPAFLLFRAEGDLRRDSLVGGELK